MQSAQTPHSDEVLVDQARSGDRQAFTELIVRHQRQLSMLCSRALGDADLADDAAQEAILQAMLSLDSLRQPAQFGAWLVGIGLNVCRRWLRSRSTGNFSLDSLHGGRQLLDAPESLSPDPAWIAEEHDLALQVLRGVETLPSGQRGAVALFYLRGLTHAETAAALGIPVGAVKTRLHKARRNLRRELWTLWKELRPMTTTSEQPARASDYVEIRVVDVRRTIPTEPNAISRNVLLLQETGAQQRIVGMWLGPLEGEAILMLSEGVEVPRPMTFTFAINLLEAAGGRLLEVRVNQLVDRTYFSEAVVAAPDGQVRIVDARPSDAIALALTRNVPIRIAEAVMQAASWPASRVEDQMRVDGEHVLGKADILQQMEQRRAQYAAAVERTRAEHRPAEQPLG